MGSIGHIACLDVYYFDTHAKACCIVFENGPDERIISQHSAIVRDIRNYIPGKFYKRELPCLLEVYSMVRDDIVFSLIDGFVTLKNGEKGLGGYFYEALGKKVPVIGVAKTFYKDCSNYIRLFRGSSNKPLFVSSIGIELNYAAELVKNLRGGNRIPDILKRVDKLTREIQ